MDYSFGWVNASYVYGLQIVNAHMKRALGAVTTWDTFKKMTEGHHGDAEQADFEAPAHVHVAPHVREAAAMRDGSALSSPHNGHGEEVDGNEGHDQEHFHEAQSGDDLHGHEALPHSHEFEREHGSASGASS